MINFLRSSVIFDSDCDYHVTWNKTWFVKNINSFINNVWMATSTKSIKIKKYDIMKIKNIINDQSKVLMFANTAYVFQLICTLISVDIVKEQDYIWDWHNDCLKKKSKKMCDMIINRGKLSFLKYNEISDVLQTHFIQIRNSQTTTTWTWHFRLDHCKLEVINQLQKFDDLIVSKNNVFILIQCITCSVFKMHKLIQRASSKKIIKPFEIFHFDLIICDLTFDEITCIAHFIDEYTIYNWVYFLIDHKKKTLISIFKALINQCDRTGILINSLIRAIRTGQETFIGKQLKNWMQAQNIQWKWSAKNIFERNGTSKRFEALLIEKIQCIWYHAEFSEDLYSECYLTTVYLMNRTSIKSQNWDSSLIALQKLTDQKIKHEMINLKIFECKAYSLLKETDTFFKSKKIKLKIFIDYLIDYDSINIFKIWNSEKNDVNNYKNVVFNEMKFFDIYENEKINLLIEIEKKDLVKFVVYESHSIVQQLDDTQQNWLDLSIRQRIEKN